MMMRTLTLLILLATIPATRAYAGHELQPWAWSCSDVLVGKIKTPFRRDDAEARAKVADRIFEFFELDSKNQWQPKNTALYSNYQLHLWDLLARLQTLAMRAAKQPRLDNAVYEAFRERYPNARAMRQLSIRLAQDVFFQEAPKGHQLFRTPILRLLHELMERSDDEAVEREVLEIWEIDLALVLSAEHRELGLEVLSELARLRWDFFMQRFDERDPSRPRWSWQNLPRAAFGQALWLHIKMMQLRADAEGNPAAMARWGALAFGAPLGVIALAVSSYLYFF